MTSISTARTDRVLQPAAKSGLSQVTYGCTDGKTVSCQVGTTLIPTVVQVADMDMTVSDPGMVKSLGLRPNAVLCPSTVELESKLTETSGIRVMDIRDVKEVGISFGKVTGKASLQDRDRGVRGLAATYEPPESCYVQFKSRQVPNLVGSEVAAPHMSSDRSVALGKRIDHNAGCTFRVRELTQTNVPEHFSQITLTSPSVISQSSWQRDTYQVVPTPNRPLRPPTQSATCQVGLVLEPTLLSVPGKVSAGHMNTTSGPGLQPSRLELSARLAEVPGVQLTSLSDTPNMTFQVGNQRYLAAVEVCDSVKRDLSKFGGMQRSLTETWTRPTSKFSSLGADNTAKLTTGQFSGDREGIRLSIEIPNIAPQPLKQQQVGKANAWGNSPKGYTTNTSETILEVTGLTNVGRRVRLRIPVDLTEILPTVDVSVNASAPKQDFLGGSGIPKTYGKLCDVACEALIIPDTLEKRVQTMA
ncbi:unnamed protein product [Dibothriocephalus latus]|uniref:Uncharacterized protein n=1 Tax=Dibothriocephalus latus TaxID=60516 RepID=A0A3P7RF54_DIBLA|nr:unnamed protein product [Dibothriocephalus latus]